MGLIPSVPKWLSALTLSIILLLAGDLSAKAQAQEDEYIGLPEGEGREVVAAYCGACHSLGLVAQQRLSRHRWEELLVWMREQQGMAKLPPEDEKVILDYLTEHLGPPQSRPKF